MTDGSARCCPNPSGASLDGSGWLCPFHSGASLEKGGGNAPVRSISSSHNTGDVVGGSRAHERCPLVSAIDGSATAIAQKEIGGLRWRGRGAVAERSDAAAALFLDAPDVVATFLEDAPADGSSKYAHAMKNAVVYTANNVSNIRGGAPMATFIPDGLDTAPAAMSFSKDHVGLGRKFHGKQGISFAERVRGVATNPTILNPFLTFEDKALEYVLENEKYMAEKGMIYRFSSFLPSLTDVKERIQEEWNPIIKVSFNEDGNGESSVRLGYHPFLRSRHDD